MRYHTWFFVLVVALMMPGMAAAQATPVAEQGGSVEGILSAAGLDVQAGGSVTYELQGFSFTDPIFYMFVGIAFTNDDDASEGMEIIAGTMETQIGSDVPEFTRVSAGRIGDERIASVGTSADDSITFGYIVVRTGRHVAVGLSLGLKTSPIQDLAPYVTDIVDRLDKNQPEFEWRIVDCLPTLDDMPPGYSLEETSGV